MSSSLRKCPGCDCTFITEDDLKLHIGKFGAVNHLENWQRFHRQIDVGAEPTLGTWRKNQWGEFMPASESPELARQCKVRGSVANGLFKVTLSQDGKWLNRKHV